MSEITATTKMPYDEGSTGAKVASIHELLENILVNLPASNILKVQAAGRHFKNCYANSKRLQIVTWERIEDSTKTTVPGHTEEQEEPCTANPLLAVLQPNFIGRFWKCQIKDKDSQDPLFYLFHSSSSPSGLRLGASGALLDQRWNATDSWTRLHLLDSNTAFEIAVLCCESGLVGGQKVNRSVKAVSNFGPGPMGDAAQLAQGMMKALKAQIWSLPVARRPLELSFKTIGGKKISAKYEVTEGFPRYQD